MTSPENLRGDSEPTHPTLEVEMKWSGLNIDSPEQPPTINHPLKRILEIVNTPDLSLASSNHPHDQAPSDNEPGSEPVSYYDAI